MGIQSIKPSVKVLWIKRHDGLYWQQLIVKPSIMMLIELKALALRTLNVDGHPGDYILVEAETRRMLETMDHIVSVSSENIEVVPKSVAFP